MIDIPMDGLVHARPMLGVFSPQGFKSVLTGYDSLLHIKTAKTQLT